MKIIATLLQTAGAVAIAAFVVWYVMNHLDASLSEIAAIEREQTRILIEIRQDLRGH